ncbi:aspartic peptidase domain-containing protein [Gigaspora rosea]|uniref:Aspartic peptidase domain-containing protein n=1 Tax=Gigaspora rosea TaxID=44941 RepID=A0A397VD07_9GLOM|nr:aspartic peptidase domain-containing protein [Gigaspora rosea]
MKLVFLFIILSVVAIHNIYAYPNSINLVKRLNIETDLNFRCKKTFIDETSSNNATSKSKKNSSTIIVPITDIGQDLGYYTSITVGNQDFFVLLDTGSSNLWISNSNCTSIECKNHRKLIQVILQLINQKVKIGQSIESDGILGLAFDSLNTMDNGAPTFISTLIKQKTIDPIFSFHFQHVNASGDKGTFTLGSVDESKFKGNITFTPVINSVANNGSWVISLKGANVNNNSLEFSRKAIIDTGTTLLIIPDDDAEAIFNQIPGSQFDPDSAYIIPCNTSDVVFS